jgi:sphingoid base N-stearoyltransferase
MQFNFSLYFLIILFSLSSISRGGVFVLFLHEPSTVFIEGMHCLDNIISTWNSDGNDNNPQSNVKRILRYILNCCFVLFSLQWFVLRLYWYPLKLIHASVIFAYRSYPFDPNLTPHIPFSSFMYFLFLILLVMNIYWSWFIVKNFIRLFKGKEISDNQVANNANDGCELNKSKHHTKQN